MRRSKKTTRMIKTYHNGTEAQKRRVLRHVNPTGSFLGHLCSFGFTFGLFFIMASNIFHFPKILGFCFSTIIVCSIHWYVPNYIEWWKFLYKLMPNLGDYQIDKKKTKW